MHHPQQSELEVETLLLLVAQFVMRAQHDLQESRQILFRKLFRHAAHALGFVARDLQKGSIRSRNLCHDCISQESHQLLREIRRILTFDHQAIHQLQHVLAGVLLDGAHQIFKHLGWHRSDQLPDDIGRQSSAATGDRLIHDRERVAHRSVSGFREKRERIVIGLDPFGLGNRFQLANNLFEPDRVKAEVLAARSDRLGDILRLGGRHHEDDVPGRLLQSLQQCIEGRIGDLVRFVENPDLVTIACRTIPRCIAQFANLINSSICGRIDLNDVDCIARPNLGTRLAHPAGLGYRMILRTAVQRHRQNSGDRGFANAAVAAEDVPVGNPLLLNGIFQRASDVVLPNHIGELLWTVFSGKDLVAHRRT